MAAPYAEPSDVATRLNLEFTAGQSSQCSALLADVSSRIRARLASLDGWIATGLVDAALVKGIACEMAMAAITVIDAGVGVDEVAQPEHRVRISTAAAAGIRLSDADMDLLTPSAVRDRRNPAFSIQPD
ncbi:MAG: hypothetical protein M3443_18315 [Actinomycetota bacterium]|nr:hypothetical protein [Actinomycetota bacterium]